MEPIDLKQTSGIVVQQDILKTAQDFQAALVYLEGSEKSRLGYEAIELMGDPDTLNGLKRVYVHAIGSMILTEGFTPLSDQFEFSAGDCRYFGDAYIKANFRRLAFIEDPLFGSICLQLLQPEFIATDIDETDLGGKRIDLNSLYVPVHAVETVLAA